MVEKKPVIVGGRTLTQVKCCGKWIYCHSITNTCPQCGADYNRNGSRLVSRKQRRSE